MENLFWKTCSFFFPKFEISSRIGLILFLFCRKIYYQIKIRCLTRNPHAIAFKTDLKQLSSYIVISDFQFAIATENI